MAIFAYFLVTNMPADMLVEARQNRQAIRDRSTNKAVAVSALT